MPDVAPDPDPDWPARYFLTKAGRPRVRVLDLGGRHYAKAHTRHGGDGTIVGFEILHPKGPNPSGAYAGSDWCCGGITLDVPQAEGLGGARWQVTSLDPLHIDPSILCDCGDHGFIHGGRWEPA